MLITAVRHQAKRLQEEAADGLAQAKQAVEAMILGGSNGRQNGSILKIEPFFYVSNI